jgi:Leucine-rich repeat (LRR) protein
MSCVQKIVDYVVDVRTTVLVGSPDFCEAFKLRCVNKEFQAAFVVPKLAILDNLKILPIMRLLPKMMPLLQSLDFNSDYSHCSNVSWILLELVAECMSLQSLKMHSAPLMDLKTAPRIASFDLLVKSLTNLRRLSLTGIATIMDVSALASLSKLEKLNLSRNRNITKIAAVASLSKLEKLNLSGTKIMDISALASLSKLEKLNLNGTSITNLSPLESLSTLTTLKLERLDQCGVRPLGVSIKPLLLLQGLQRLHLAGTTVHVSECPNETLSALTNLVYLTWSEDAHRLKDSTLLALPMLENVVLEDVSCFGDNHVLKTNKLTQLQCLRLSCSRGITDAGLASFIGLKSLYGINASHCDSITDAGVASLASIPSLRRLDINVCDNVTMDDGFCMPCTGCGGTRYTRYPFRTFSKFVSHSLLLSAMQCCVCGGGTRGGWPNPRPRSFILFVACSCRYFVSSLLSCPRLPARRLCWHQAHEECPLPSWRS